MEGDYVFLCGVIWCGYGQEEAVRGWLRGVDLNHRPLGYEPNELPDCSTPQFHHNNVVGVGQTSLVWYILFWNPT